MFADKNKYQQSGHDEVLRLVQLDLKTSYIVVSRYLASLPEKHICLAKAKGLHWDLRQALNSLGWWSGIQAI